jgi:hypothetical protein
MILRAALSLPIRSTRHALLCALLLIHGLAARGAEPLTRSEQSVINFGFATQLGSGIYSVSGRTLQVYKLPFGYTFPAADESRLRVHLTLPVTIGLLDFKPLDVVDNGLPENLDTLSFVPGLEFQIDVRDGWRVEPFVEAGIARDRTNELDQRVYSIGLRNSNTLARGETEWVFSEEILRIVVDQDGGSTDDCTRLRLGTTARRPFGGAIAARPTDALFYAVVDVYTDTPGGPADGEGASGSDAQMEIGVTFGTIEPLRIWRIPLPRVGLGYRFGDELSVFRFVLGAPF